MYPRTLPRGRASRCCRHPTLDHAALVLRGEELLAFALGRRREQLARGQVTGPGRRSSTVEIICPAASPHEVFQSVVSTIGPGRAPVAARVGRRELRPDREAGVGQPLGLRICSWMYRGSAGR